MDDEVPIRLQTLITNVSNDNITIRCTKAIGRDIYIGCSDGSLIRCSLRNDGPSTGDVYTVTSRQMIANRKPIDDLALIPSVSKALVLAGGIIYSYTLPSLDPIPTNSIQPIRGAAAFALDDEDERKDHYAPPRPVPANTAPWVGGGQKQQMDPVSLYVFRDMRIYPYTLAQRMTPTKTEGLALERPPTLVKRSGRYLCIADAEFYSMGDLEAKTQILLAPVLPGVRPLIEYVQPGEFLISSPVGDSSLGVFLNGAAEPTRNAIEWPGHPLSFCLDLGHVLALLPNHTVQIHSLPEAETVANLLHTIRLDSSIPPTLLPSLISHNPGVFQVPAEDRSRYVRLVKFPLINSRSLPPIPAASPSLDASSGFSTPQPPTPPAKPSSPAPPPTTMQTVSLISSRTLVVGPSGLQAIVPPPFIQRVESLLEYNKLSSVVSLLSTLPPSSDMKDDRVIDKLYTYGRLALKCIAETMFDDAAEYFFQSRLDPRILIRLFPDLRGGLIGEGDTVNVFQGVEEQLRHAESIQDIIMANLVRNYAPIQPNVATAPSTVELNKVLMESARVMLMRYLRLVREARRDANANVASKMPGSWSVGLSEAEINKWRAVDTVYLKLLAETGQRAEFVDTFVSSQATIALDEIIPILRQYGYLSLLVDIYRQTHDERGLLDLWTQLAEGSLVDPTISNPVGEIIQTLSTTNNRALIQEYGIWLARHEPVAAFTLFTSLPPPMPSRDSRRAPPQAAFDSQAILTALRGSSTVVADQYLEFLVFNRNSEDSNLHEELAAKYVDALLDLMNQPATVQALEDLVSEYKTAPSKGPFTLYLAKHTTLSVDIRSTRLKAALFLQGSQHFDAAAMRKRFEPFKDRLLLERAILDGKLGNDRSALTLLAQLRDFSSAEAYCTLGGEVIPGKVALQIGELFHLQEWARLVAAPRAVAGKAKRGRTVDEQRVKALLRILMEVYTQGGRTAMSSEAADLLNSQGMNLDAHDVLNSVPPSWSLSSISSFLTRSFRRSQHRAHEESIIKGIAWGQNLRVTDRAFTVIREQGGMVEEPSEDQPPSTDYTPTPTEEEASQGEPSSFSEKESVHVVVPGPAPVVGSVTSVDLARKEGFGANSGGSDSNAELV